MLVGIDLVKFIDKQHFTTFADGFYAVFNLLIIQTAFPYSSVHLLLYLWEEKNMCIHLKCDWYRLWIC